MLIDFDVRVINPCWLSHPASTQTYIWNTTSAWDVINSVRKLLGAVYNTTTEITNQKSETPKSAQLSSITTRRVSANMLLEGFSSAIYTRYTFRTYSHSKKNKNKSYIYSCVHYDTRVRAGPAEKWTNHPKVASREPLWIWAWNL